MEKGSETEKQKQQQIRPSQIPSDDGVRPDPELINYIQEGYEEGRTKRMLVREPKRGKSE